MPEELLPLIRQLDQGLERRVRAQIAQRFGLTTTQVLALDCLLRRQGAGLCAADLHRRLGVSKAALSDALRDLCARGYLQALPCPGDDRKKRLALTPKALALHRQVRQTAAALERQLCHGLTPGQQDAAEHTLRLMLQNLGGA